MTTTHCDLQSSIHLINDFCADTETFSFNKLTFLKLKGLTLRINAELQELTMVINTAQDSQALLCHLTPHKRLYQLLGQHFKQVHIELDKEDEPNILLESIPLACDPTGLRDINSLGARLRRTLNVALQGHICVLKLHDDQEIAYLKTLLERKRVKQLFRKYGIIHCYDVDCKFVHICKASLLEECKQTVIVI